MGSSKNNNRSISDRSHTLLDRLHQALNLGTWHGGKWQCTDIQIQRQVVRSVLAFLDYVTKDELSNLIVKDSMSAAVKALVSILEHKNVTVLSLAADAVSKLVSVLHDSILQPFVLDLVGPLSSLLSYHQTEVSVLCAKVLDLMLSKPALLKNEKGVWDVLKRTETVRHAISIMRSSSGGTMQIELFLSMASLSSAILRRWPLSRFPVYSDAALMTMLSDVLAKPDSCGKVEVMKLLSSIALCGSGAMKLLENGESLLGSIVQCMDSSQPHSVRLGGFTLARRLAVVTMNEERFSKMSSLCREPLVRAIISGMWNPCMDLRKASGEQISLVRKACRLALITRWGGEHHLLFWKHGISAVLLDLLHTEFPQNCLSVKEQILIPHELLKCGSLLAVRNYAWEILGWLAIHCEEGFNPEEPGSKLCMDLLISFTGSNFVNATHRLKVYSNGISPNLKEFPIRAFFMMIYSPCKYIASEARSLLAEFHAPHDRDILKAFMSYLKDIQSGNSFSRQDDIINVMALACYIGLPEFRSWVLELSGLKVLVALVRRCLSNPAISESLTVSDSTRKRTCCYVSSEGWEGKDLLMLYSLWGLAELIKHLKCIGNDLSSGRMKYTVPELVEYLQEICLITSGSGVRWFASYALSSLGLYGFPSTPGIRFGKAIRETGLADTRLILKNGEHLSAHSVVLSIRCPSLLQHGNKASHSSEPISTETSWELQKEIRLSSRVDQQALLKILDFVYLGYLQAGEQDTRLLKSLAKSCDLQPLLQMLCHERPKWGTPFPEFDLHRALGSVGFQFSDVTLEVEKNELQNWKCDFCTSSAPHFHVHKVVLASRCSYMRGLFCSGMRESFLNRVKLDLSFEAMVKLVAWFYTDELPSPASGCLWEYMSDEEKLQELEPYVELCWRFDYWTLEDIKKACLQMVVSHLESALHLSIKMIKVAVCLNVPELVEVAAKLAAPLYRQFHGSGELEGLDEDIVHKIRSTSVQYALGNLRLRDHRLQLNDF